METTQPTIDIRTTSLGVTTVDVQLGNQWIVGNVFDGESIEITHYLATHVDHRPATIATPVQIRV